MSARMCFLVAAVAACVLVFCRPVLASVIPDEDWNYVDVRPGAHMFWWLYGSTGTARETRPLVLWLQVSLRLVLLLLIILSFYTGWAWRVFHWIWKF